MRLENTAMRGIPATDSCVAGRLALSDAVSAPSTRTFCIDIKARTAGAHIICGTLSPTELTL